MRWIFLFDSRGIYKIEFVPDNLWAVFPVNIMFPLSNEINSKRRASRDWQNFASNMCRLMNLFQKMNVYCSMELLYLHHRP